MAVVAATIAECVLVEGPAGSIQNSSTGSRKTYRLLLNIGSQTAGDTGAVVTCDDKIEAITKLGKTVTLREAAGGPAGLTPGGTAAYAIIASVSGTTLAFSVGGPTAAAVVAAGTQVPIFVTVDES
jgi:hypothetical protein